MKKIVSKGILALFRFCAKIQLKKINPEVIGVTGSAGKTSTVMAIKTILESKFSVKISEKSNSESGIPLNILNLHPKDYSLLDWLRLVILSPIKVLIDWNKYEKYVVEMGIDSPYEPKNMSYLLRIIQPHVGIFLNALPTHTEFFEDKTNETDSKKREDKLREKIASEKGKLIQSIPNNGCAILNNDDPFVSIFSSQTKAKILSVGKSNSSITIKTIHKDLKGFKLIIEFENKEYALTIKDQILNNDYAYSICAALAVGIYEKIPIETGILVLERNFKLPPGRMSIIPGIKNSVILDSSYNASKWPMIEALNTLKGIKGKRHIAVLGDMRELGSESINAHEDIAENITSGIDTVITVGPLMEKYFIPKLISLGYPTQNVHTFKNILKVGNFLKEHVIRGNEVILFKGSQNTIFLEKAVEEIMENPLDAPKLLCRRGKFWDGKRETP